MAIQEALAPPAAARPLRSLLRNDGVCTLLATLVFAALYAVKGFPDLLTKGGDNDSLMRLVEVRDWIGGQGWFDLHQFRMGLEGGFVMHWSRLVDASLGALVLLGRLVGGSQATGELFAQFAWPLLLFAGSIFALLKIIGRAHGEAAVLPALVLGTAALQFVGIFAPGNIDHHSAQLCLTLCAMALLLRGGTTEGAIAGVCAALMLGIGAETAPYVAAAGLFVALRFGGEGEPARGQAFGFGAGFGVAAALVFFGTVAPSHWFEPACDAFSAPQGLLGAVGGAGLAAIAASRPLCRNTLTRLGALLLLGAACAGLAVALFPQCLGNPYAGIDPLLKTYWLDGVAEAQPFSQLLLKHPVLAAGYYATPFLGLAWLAWELVRARAAVRPLLLPGLMLLTAFLVSLWQVRGAYFSLPLAVPALSWFVSERRRAAEQPGAPRTASATMALAWLVSMPLVWCAAFALLIPPSPSEAAEPSGAAGVTASCGDAAVFDPLAALPPANVAAISNLGSLILAHTPHRVLSGPYHRNEAGDLAALKIWLAEPREAQSRLQAAAVNIVAFCPGNDETGSLAGAAPRSLIAGLAKGQVPAWLQPVAGTEGSPLKLYRFLP